MLYFQMNGQINADMEQRFIEFVNQHQDSDIMVILNTSGGGYFQAESISHIINEHKSVTIFIQAAYSAGFMLLYKTTCKVIISKTCRGMWHFGTWAISMNDKSKPAYHEDECILSCMPFHAKETKAIANKCMTKEEYKKFLKDDDIYFNTKRMRQIFSDRIK